MRVLKQRLISLPSCGEVPERSNGAVSKTVVRAIVPRVRIPPSPPMIPMTWTDVPDPSKVIKSAFLRQFATNAKIILRNEQGLFVMEMTKMAKHTKTKEPGIYYRGPAQYEVKIRRKGVAVSRTFDTFADALQFKATTVSKIDGDTFIDKTREKRTRLSTVIDL